MSKGCFGQFSEPAGHNLSERREGPENVSCGSRPSAGKGKAAIQEHSNDNRALDSAGVMTMARGKGTPTQHGRSVPVVVWKQPTGASRGADRAWAEGGEARSTVEAG
jgi:hypothetical protein